MRPFRAPCGQTLIGRVAVLGMEMHIRRDQHLPGELLALRGEPMRVAQYAIGNPLLAIQMIEHTPEAALYAPLRLVVYENHAGKAFIAYERFTSQLAQ